MLILSKNFFFAIQPIRVRRFSYRRRVEASAVGQRVSTPHPMQRSGAAAAIGDDLGQLCLKTFGDLRMFGDHVVLLTGIVHQIEQLEL